MKKALVFAGCLLLLFLSAKSVFWNKCIRIDNKNVEIFVIDPDIMGIDNYDSNEYAILAVECPKETQYQLAFSNCANGCPLYPDSSIRIKSGISKVCEDDVIYVFKRKCKIQIIELIKP